ncbi:hypothetical protein [Rhizobium leguminosarum]|uniref:hypothetical protein n=1 Tax=Rhizobium leguminosarum TaxID=384 RepID=UPI00103D019B|nr:hypothetical protein [Rhizobium leguminosarum]TBZ14677.1 hypothetical protein E0H33_15265 [Rhizobium leguminosarum bv. viciae]
MDLLPSPPPDGHPDRFLKCQEVIDDAFSLIAAAAVEAGWKPEEVAAALVELADNHVLALLVNRDLERGLATSTGS